MNETLGDGLRRHVRTLLLAILMAAANSDPVPAGETGFLNQLSGNWRGSGIATLYDRRRYRVTCDATYSVSATGLSARIDCDSDYGNIRLRARVNHNSRQISGFWEEKVLGLAGAIVGTARGERLVFTVLAAVPVQMIVDVGTRHHRVSIAAENVPIRQVEVTMNRR